MAKPNSSSPTLLAIALILSLFLALSVAQTRVLQGEAQGATVKCLITHGVEAGETCFEVEKKFKVGEDFFDLINPNLNCSALFVGQWLCVDGTVG